MSPQETLAFIQHRAAEVGADPGAARRRALRCQQPQPFSSQAQARTTHSRPPNSEQRRIEAFSARPRCELDGPAEAAARVLGVDRDRRAALAHVADQLADAAGALLDRRGAGLGDVAKIEAVAVGAADADREGACRFGGADHGDQEAHRGNRERANCAENSTGMEAPPLRNPQTLAGKSFQTVNKVNRRADFLRFFPAPPAPLQALPAYRRRSAPRCR